MNTRTAVSIIFLSGILLFTLHAMTSNRRNTRLSLSNELDGQIAAAEMAEPFAIDLFKKAASKAKIHEAMMARLADTAEHKTVRINLPPINGVITPANALVKTVPLQQKTITKIVMAATAPVVELTLFYNGKPVWEETQITGNKKNINLVFLTPVGGVTADTLYVKLREPIYMPIGGNRYQRPVGATVTYWQR